MIFCVLLFAGCADRNTWNGPLYEGKPLTIGVIGEAPEVRETNVSFVPLGLEEMAKNPEKLSSRFDAVFITKDYFREAYAPQYKKAYQEAGLPFIFIQIDKLLPMYMEEDVSYDDAPSANDLRFAAGNYRSPTGEETQVLFAFITTPKTKRISKARTPKFLKRSNPKAFGSNPFQSTKRPDPSGRFDLSSLFVVTPACRPFPAFACACSKVFCPRLETTRGSAPK